MRKFEIIDFLKGYSIFTIMIFHYLAYLKLPQPFDTLISFGGSGVHLFVLLSGFGLYFSHLKKPLKYLSFMKKRGFKIYFPYIVTVLITSLISVFIPIHDNSVYTLGGHIFLYKMFDDSIIGSYGYQLWFISMIIQFYLSFHFLVWVKKKVKNSSFFIISMIISLSWPLWVIYLGKEAERVWNGFFLQYLWEFALGMIIAEKIFKKETLYIAQLRSAHLLLIGITSCTIYAFLAIKGGSIGKITNDVFVLFGYSALAVWLYKLDLKLINSLFIFIGNISLSVYLLHMLVLSTTKMIYQIDPVFIVTFSIFATLVLSVIYQKAITMFLDITIDSSSQRAVLN